MNWLELLGFFLTLVVLLYLFIGDNPLFRLVSYLFVGVASGYVFVLLIFQVLLPRIELLLQSGDLAFFGLGLVSFVLGALLIFKLWPRTSRLGNLSMAILVGVGAAVAVGGAVFGTIAGQLSSTFALFPSLGELLGNFDVNVVLIGEGIFVLIGTITTLVYFQFSVRNRTNAPVPANETTARRAGALELLATIGQIFIGITLGAMFAGVFTAAISALVERIHFIFGIFF
jgi:hypothetical protein